MAGRQRVKDLVDLSSAALSEKLVLVARTNVLALLVLAVMKKKLLLSVMKETMQSPSGQLSCTPWMYHFFWCASHL